MQAIRPWIVQDPAAQTGWLGALSDERVGTAIARIHSTPAQVGYDSEAVFSRACKRVTGITSRSPGGTPRREQRPIPRSGTVSHD